MFSQEFEAVVTAARGKSDLLKNRPWAYLLASILAGAFIAFGVILSNTAASLSVNTGLSRIVSGLTFAGGLSLVVFAGAELFTGNHFTIGSGMLAGRVSLAEGLKVLDAVLEGTDVQVATTQYDLGAERWHRTGETLTDEDLESIKTHEAILLGAVGDPSVPSGVLERGLLLKLRFALDHYVNLRPNKYYPGVPTPLANPGDIDFLVVREGTEGLYCGNGGVVRQGTPQEIATEVSVNTAYGVERVVRYAFEKANARPRKKLTYVH